MRFTTRTMLMTTILTATLAMATAQAQTADEHAAHHSDGSAMTATQPATPGSPTSPAAGNAGGMMQMMGSGGSQGGQSGMMGGMMQKMRMTQTMMAPGGMGSVMALLSADHLDGRLAYLRAELKITDAQTAQWNAFADTVRSDANALQHARTQLPSGSGVTTTPDWIEHQASLMAARAEALKTMAGAERSLSSVLTGEQKKLVDKLLTAGMPGMRASGT
ncbi:MAG: Spy/CpxP family protein refolding chaperone [Rhodopila sp.]|nr:Spy/CpxP family protein refolding chaperone [Rhodopila sp.]